MEAIEFITKCNSYIEEIREVIRPDLASLIDELKEIDPHDLVKPDTFFRTENDMREYACNLFLQKVKKYSV